MTADLHPFVVHIAGASDPNHIQRCVPCGVILIDNTAWFEGRVAVPVGQDAGGPGWWPTGALIGTDKQAGSQAGSVTYVVEGRALAPDERACSELIT